MSSSLTDALETVANYEQMLDAGYLMLDDEESSIGKFHYHPVSSLPGRSSERAKTGNQNPGSVDTGAVFIAAAKIDFKILCNYRVYIPEVFLAVSKGSNHS